MPFATVLAVILQMIFPRPILLLIALALVDAACGGPEERRVDGVTYRVLSVPAEALRIVWKDQAGNQLRTFQEAARALEARGMAVDTLMNGGIFEPGGIPSGLLVQDGRQLHPVNRNAGEGNFFLKPNGIFLGGSKGAAVISTEEYPLKGVEVSQAVQSGPLLLRGGKVHPAFNAHSTSRLHRNGIGVTKDGRVVLAITDFHSPKFPNLFEFAELFRSLGCSDALFLDGDISQMRSGAELAQQSNQFGSIIAVVNTGKNPAPPDGVQPASAPAAAPGKN
jgi:uncharacterized protein YigE (DUF2233 family)